MADPSTDQAEYHERGALLPLSRHAIPLFWRGDDEIRLDESVFSGTEVSVCDEGLRINSLLVRSTVDVASQLDNLGGRRLTRVAFSSLGIAVLASPSKRADQTSLSNHYIAPSR
jgi:hypothetical protein